MHQTSDPDPPRPYPEWLRPVAADLERLAVPPDLACWTLALLDATEADMGPTPRADWDGSWLYLTWGAGDRVLRVEAMGLTPICYWNRSGPGAHDLARPLRCDHAAVLRDLLGWLLRGEGVSFHPQSQVRRKWWLP